MKQSKKSVKLVLFLLIANKILCARSPTIVLNVNESSFGVILTILVILVLHCIIVAAGSSNASKIDGFGSDKCHFVKILKKLAKFISVCILPTYVSCLFLYL